LMLKCVLARGPPFRRLGALRELRHQGTGGRLEAGEAVAMTALFC